MIQKKTRDKKDAKDKENKQNKELANRTRKFK